MNQKATWHPNCLELLASNSWSRVDAMLDRQSKTPQSKWTCQRSPMMTPHSTFPHASPYRIPMEKKAWQEGVMQGITGWWYTYPSEKWWSSSVSLFHSQYMESHKIPWFHHQPDFSIWEPVPKKNLLKCHPKGYQAAHHQCDIFHVQTPGGHICGHQCLAGALGEILVRWSHLWPLKKSVVFKKKRQILHDLMKQCQNTNGISVTKLNLGHLMVN